MKLFNCCFLLIIFKCEIVYVNWIGILLLVLIIDVDKFKEINDMWGYNIGDEILCKVFQVFYDNVCSSDYVFCYGGDEFIIVLTEVFENEMLCIVECICSWVEKIKLKVVNGEDIVFLFFIGVVMFNGYFDYECFI